MQKHSGKDVSRRDEQVKKILQEIGEHKKAAEKKGGHAFTGLDEDQIRRKLSRAKSPMIIFQTWSGSVSAGGTVSYSVGINNPDPSDWVWVFGHVFVGPANMIASVGEALDAVDTRFARLTAPGFPGQTIAANATVTLTYSLPVPTGIPSTNYQGNTFVYQADWHDVGDYLDRGTFVFGVG